MDKEGGAEKIGRCGRAFCVRFDYKFKLVSLSLLRDYISRRILRPGDRGVN